MNYFSQYGKCVCDGCLSFVRTESKSKESYSPKFNEESNISANNKWSSDVQQDHRPGH